MSTPSKKFQELMKDRYPVDVNGTHIHLNILGWIGLCLMTLAFAGALVSVICIFFAGWKMLGLALPLAAIGFVTFLVVASNTQSIHYRWEAKNAALNVGNRRLYNPVDMISALRVSNIAQVVKIIDEDYEKRLKAADLKRSAEASLMEEIDKIPVKRA